MDSVLARIVHPHRPEGIEADVQGHEGDSHTAITNRRQQRRREVQASRRRRRRPFLASVDRLVPLTVRKSLLDVGRRGHLTDAADFRKWIGDAVEPHGCGLPVPRLDGDGQRRSLERDLGACPQPAGGSDQRLPAGLTFRQWA